MKLGRKLAEGIATDREADTLSSTPVAPVTTDAVPDDVVRVDAATTAEPVRAAVRTERHVGV